MGEHGFLRMSNLNHKERYVVDVVGDEIKLYDTFAQANVLTLPYSDNYRAGLVTLMSIVNSQWSEISRLRGEQEKK